jgi:peptidoglycan-associated lipoprotein
MKRTDLVKILLLAGVLLCAVLLVVGCAKKVAPPVEQPKPVQVAPDTAGTAARLAAEAAAAAERARQEELAAAARAEQAAKGMIQIVYFDYDKSNLRPDAREAANTDAGIIQKYPNWKVRIEGNCDERGTEEYNLALGERRANTVKDFFVQYGIDGGRLSTVSYGETRPAATGHDESAWAKNRRAELVIP